VVGVQQLLKAVTQYSVHSLLLVVVKVEATMVLVHLVVLAVQEVERLVLMLVARLALAQQVKVLMAALQRLLGRLVAVAAAEQVR
jgi:hypothetical protein